MSKILLKEVLDKVKQEILVEDENGESVHDIDGVLIAGNLIKSGKVDQFVDDHKIYLKSVAEQIQAAVGDVPIIAAIGMQDIARLPDGKVDYAKPTKYDHLYKIWFDAETTGKVNYDYPNKLNLQKMM